MIQEVLGESSPKWLEMAQAESTKINNNSSNSHHISAQPCSCNTDGTYLTAFHTQRAPVVRCLQLH